ncbi:unnamed protein product, partial [Rotaria sordida]
SPAVHTHAAGRSRCSSNTSSSSPLSSGSTVSQGLMITNSSITPLAIIGDESFRLYELSAFVEINRTIATTHPSLIYPTSEAYSAHQHDLIRLHANDIQMKNIQTFETISIDQIFDKFPHYDGLKDLYERNPYGSFFLIKFWADVPISSSITNSINIRDESFFTSFTYTSCSNRPIHISTRLCSFGKQVLEKVETSEHPQRDQFDQYIYRFDRSPLCDYMVQFIQKLRSLPNTCMMNSVLEMAMASQHMQLLQSFRKVIPPLLFDTHKGEAGRIGVVGGSEEYTGAPIFASMAAFRTGADLVHVFCAKSAAIPIKSFSPDLIVHPLLDSPSFSDDIDKWLPRLHALVIGPGLGRDEKILSNVEQLIGILRKQEHPIPIVIDADGLHLITEKPHLINNYENCILTPNVIEFERLYAKVTGVKSDEIKQENDKRKLAQKLAETLHVNILMKGHLDTISSPNSQEPIQCGIDGSPRRCGGQGDLLAGALVTSYCWAIKNRDKIEHQSSNSERSPTSNERINYLSKSTPAQVAAYAASTLVRTASQGVFNKLGRSMISADILKEIGPTFNKIFEK